MELELTSLAQLASHGFLGSTSLCLSSTEIIKVCGDDQLSVETPGIQIQASVPPQQALSPGSHLPSLHTI